MTIAPAPSHIWTVRHGRTIDLSRRSLIMGILNVTPDSFSDGGQFDSVEAAADHGSRLLAEGADILDIGGQSTRPGRPDGALSIDEEIRRTEPVIRLLRQRHPDALLSIDTFESAVAEAAADAGVDILNDITAMRHGGNAMTSAVVRHGLGVVLMHMQGTPETMQQNPQYGDVTVEVGEFLKERVRAATDAGIPLASIAIDPGIGFGKSDDHNLQLIAGLEYFRLIQRPILVGASRKGFLARLTDPNLAADQRDHLGLAIHTAAALNGASIIRTHEVKQARQALSLMDALKSHM
jgi:dihydropteroate synthase